MAKLGRLAAAQLRLERRMLRAALAMAGTVKGAALLLGMDRVRCGSRVRFHGLTTARRPSPRNLIAAAKRRAERRVIDRALRKAHGQASLAARLVGVNRTEFYKVLKRHGIDVRPGNSAWHALSDR